MLKQTQIRIISYYPYLCCRFLLYCTSPQNLYVIRPNHFSCFIAFRYSIHRTRYIEPSKLKTVRCEQKNYDIHCTGISNDDEIKKTEIQAYIFKQFANTAKGSHWRSYNIMHVQSTYSSRSFVYSVDFKRQCFCSK